MKRLKGLRERMSYANVAATLALFLALAGGTAIAANQITARDIAPDAVGGSELKKDAAKGKHVKEDTLGPVPSAGRANNVLWAVVNNPNGNPNANVVRAGQDGTAAIEGGAVVEVEFSRDVTNCVYSATRASVGTGVEQAGFVQANGGATPTRVAIRTRNVQGDVVDGDFHLIVIC
jgi:Tfp pilus assembly protein FimT